MGFWLVIASAWFQDQTDNDSESRGEAESKFEEAREAHMRQPSRCHLVLVTDLYEGGDEKGMLKQIDDFIQAGVNVIVSLALSDDGKPSYHEEQARAISSMGCPVFACTPDQLPDFMAVALQRGDVPAWAAWDDIASITPRIVWIVWHSSCTRSIK